MKYQKNSENILSSLFYNIKFLISYLVLFFHFSLYFVLNYLEHYWITRTTFFSINNFLNILLHKVKNWFNLFVIIHYHLCITVNQLTQYMVWSDQLVLKQKMSCGILYSPWSHLRQQLFKITACAHFYKLLPDMCVIIAAPVIHEPRKWAYMHKHSVVHFNAMSHNSYLL